MAQELKREVEITFIAKTADDKLRIEILKRLFKNMNVSELIKLENTARNVCSGKYSEYAD